MLLFSRKNIIGMDFDPGRLRRCARVWSEDEDNHSRGTDRVYNRPVYLFQSQLTPLGQTDPRTQARINITCLLDDQIPARRVFSV